MAGNEDIFDVILDGLWAQEVGENILKIAKGQSWARGVETRAIRLLARIQALLDNEKLDDATCLQRMDEVLNAWRDAGLRSTRHADLE